MALEIRTLDESDFADWVRALRTGFHQGPSATEGEIADRRSRVDLDRTRGAFDRGQCVATFRSMPQELTVPGGATVAASAITNVSVTGTHRRRGLATRLMGADLADAKERGDAVSILTAAEYPIYGRYGFGPATWISDWEVELPRAALDGRYAGPPEGRVEVVSSAEVRKLGPGLHERVRTRTPGAIRRDARWWEFVTGGAAVYPDAHWQEAFAAVYRGPDGTVDGLVRYDTTDHPWPGKLPKVDVSVRDLIAATPAAEAALWRFLLSLDWVTLLRSGHRAPDDVLPLLLGDPRAARTETLADFMWLRLLDVPVALSARSYAPVAAELVLDVRDPAGPAGGTFLLETAQDGPPRCSPARATSAPDLTLDIADLACLYLGDESALRLADLGRLTEHRPGAAATADLLFRTPRRPWCPDIF